MKARWGSLEDRLGIVSGKQVIALFSDWSHVKFGAVLSPSKIIKSINERDVPSEMRVLLTAIEKGTALA